MMVPLKPSWSVKLLSNSKPKPLIYILVRVSNSFVGRATRNVEFLGIIVAPYQNPVLSDDPSLGLL